MNHKKTVRESSVIVTSRYSSWQ